MCLSAKFQLELVRRQRLLLLQQNHQFGDLRQRTNRKQQFKETSQRYNTNIVRLNANGDSLEYFMWRATQQVITGSHDPRR